MNAAVLRIALLGYGRMGKAIEEVARERGHTIALRATRSAAATAEALRSADVALDFSSADAVAHHVALCVDAGIPLVIGTTGWNPDVVPLSSAAEHVGIVVGANFSMGVAIVVRLARTLAQLLRSDFGYQLHVHEVHHRAKRDHPSGTAMLLARTLAENLHWQAQLVIGADAAKLSPTAITISSARVGTIAGIHSILADSEADTIEVTHTAKSRRGFALGAVLAAEWIIGKRGLFRFDEVAFDILHAA